MDNRKCIRSGNIINFDESTKIYVHSGGGRKSQTTLIKAYKDDTAQLIAADISPLRPRPEANNKSSSIFYCFDIDEENPLHMSET